MWHGLDADAALKQLKSARGGLSSSEARRRLRKVGLNQLPEPPRPSAFAHLADQFRNPLIPILFLAAGLSAVLGQSLEAATIVVILVFCVGLGFFQESRAEKALQALRELAAPHATVLRDGRPHVVSARQLVPGDVVLLQAGDRVPADARLLETHNLRADESPLTGESEPVNKVSDALANRALPVGDRRNLVHAGTAITYGRARGVVTATGTETEVGRLSVLLGSVERGATPLQANLDRLGRVLAVLAAGVAVLVVAAGLHRGADWLDMLLFGVALGVAVVPEALPAVVTIALAAGVTRMAARHALVRKLPAVETLGSVDVICADKTGTLTRDEMTLRRVVLAGHELDVSGEGYAPDGDFTERGHAVVLTDTLQAFLEASALASDARLLPTPDGWEAQGDPTESALVVAAVKGGIDLDALHAAYPRVGEIPFSSERKRMTTLHQAGEGRLACTKGAPEVILPAATAVLTDGGERALSPGERDSLLDEARAMAEQGLRVIAVARHRDTGLEAAEQELCLLGLAGIQDPPRAEVADAIATCHKAGIRTVMITGDHPGTARAVASELGLLDSDTAVVTGADLDAMSADELAARVQQIGVYARVAPEHKLRIVAAWQKAGCTVAMTGDGVNDAPALRKANVGIAMGRTGTEVSREAADMTLTDDNFASIEAAIEEGRKIFDNIQKFLLLLLSTNLGEIGLIAGATLVGAPLPLTAAQILLVNLATDGLPAIALAVDPVEEDVMERAPRNPQTGVFTRPVTLLLVLAGIWTGAVTLALYLGARALGYSQAHAMTLTFSCLFLIEFIQAFCFRSQHVPVIRRPFANGWLNLAVGSQVLLLLLLLYTPFLQRAFGTVALGPADWLLVGMTAGSILPVIELVKASLRRQRRAAG